MQQAAKACRVKAKCDRRRQYSASHELQQREETETNGRDRLGIQGGGTILSGQWLDLDHREHPSLRRGFCDARQRRTMSNEHASGQRAHLDVIHARDRGESGRN